MTPEMMREFVDWGRSRQMVGISVEKFPEWFDAAQAALDSKRERQIAARHGAVAVVPISGIIDDKASIFERLGLTISADTISRRIRAALADSDVKAVVLDINSPGGVVSGVPELAAEIRSLRGDKPIVAHANFLAASAAYWIASAADEVIATPSAYVGSVGAYVMHVDWSGALEEMGVDVTLIAEPAEKVEGNPFEPLSEEAEAQIRKLVDQVVATFRADVAVGRGLRRNQVTNEWARVYTAADALEMGMVDKVRPMRATLERLGAVQDSSDAAQMRRDRALAMRQRQYEEAVALGHIPS